MCLLQFHAFYFMLLFSSCSFDPIDLHSFPTRRSSDLAMPWTGLYFVFVSSHINFVDGYLYFGHNPSTKLIDRKSTRLNSSHTVISYAVFCLKKKKKKESGNVNMRLIFRSCIFMRTHSH